MRELSQGISAPAQGLVSFAAAISLILALWFLYLVYIQIIDRKSGLFGSLQLFFFSAGCLIIALRAVYPRFYEILPGAMLIVFSALLMLRSFNKLLGLRRQLAWLVGLILPVLISQAAYSWLWPQRAVRLMLSGGALALIAFYLAWVLWGRHLNEFRRTAHAISVTFIIVGAFQLLRVVAGIASTRDAEKVWFPSLPWLDLALLAYLPLAIWSFVPSLSYLALYLDKLRIQQQDRQFLLDFALESTVDAVWDYNILTDELSLFGDWEKMLGYAKGELICSRENLDALTHPVDVEKTRLVFADYAAGKLPQFDLRIRMRAKSGKYVWVKSRGIIAARDAEQRPTRVIGTLKNINDEVQDQLQAEENAALLDAIFTYSPAAIAAINREKQLVRGNPQLFALAQADSLESLRHRLQHGVFWQMDEKGSPRSGDRPKSLSFQKIETPITEEFGFSLTPDGPIRWFLAQIAYVAEFDFLLFMAAEITELVKTRLSLAEVLRNLEVRVEQRTEELAQINRELEAFSYSLSHDLRAPVTRAENWLQLLQYEARQKLGEKEANMLAHVRSDLAAMKTMIQAMLTLSRVSRTELHFSKVSIAQEAEQIVEQLRMENPHKNIELQLVNTVTVFADRELVRILLRNLFENAVKFSREKNPVRIELQCAASDDGVECSVRDFGVGFDMRYADKLFAPFQRLHSEKEFTGTGIGLATAQRIVHRHGGKIWAEAQPGQGAVFFFTLPGRMQEQVLTGA